MNPHAVLPDTVGNIRRKHRIFRKPDRSRPRRISGYLTAPQIALSLGVQTDWIYDRIHDGKIEITKDKQTGLYLFPDQPETLDLFQQLKAGILQNLRFK